MTLFLGDCCHLSGQPSLLERDPRMHESMLQRLELPDWTTECFAILGILDSELLCATSDACGHCSGVQTF
ncbi:hypothetical protein D3C80_1961530 [compost metagenome]